MKFRVITAAALALALSACGSSAHQTLTQNHYGALSAKVGQACALSGKLASDAACARAAKALTGNYAVSCGHGVTTNGACVFANRLVSTFAALNVASRKPTAVGIDNPGGLITQSICDPQGSNDWLCYVTSASSQVYVHIATGGHS